MDMVDDLMGCEDDYKEEYDDEYGDEQAAGTNQRVEEDDTDFMWRLKMDADNGIGLHDL